MPAFAILTYTSACLCILIARRFAWPLVQYSSKGSTTPETRVEIPSWHGAYEVAGATLFDVHCLYPERHGASWLLAGCSPMHVEAAWVPNPCASPTAMPTTCTDCARRGARSRSRPHAATSSGVRGLSAGPGGLGGLLPGLRNCWKAYCNPFCSSQGHLLDGI